MIRYFYTDPLKAAWMVKYFKMRIFCTTGYPERFRIGFGVNLAEDSETPNCAYIEMAFQEGAKYYIHQDSLHLIEPQVGDLLFGAQWAGYRLIISPDGIPHCLGKLPYAIALRGDIPFMWPEQEIV